MNPRDELSDHPVAPSRQNGAIPYPSDRVLEEVSRKATQLERRTRALEAENTKLRREHTKALLAAAQAQDALKEFHASATDEPFACDAAPSPATPAEAPALSDGGGLHDRRAGSRAATASGTMSRPGTSPDDADIGVRRESFPGEAPPSEPPPHEADRSSGAEEQLALGSLTIAACLIAMTVNYAILLRYLLRDWLTGLSWPAF